MLEMNKCDSLPLDIWGPLAPGYCCEFVLISYYVGQEWTVGCGMLAMASDAVPSVVLGLSFGPLTFL